MRVYSEGNQPRGFTESYVVTYIEQNSEGYWETNKERRYFTMNSRSAHKQVVAKWRMDMCGKKVGLKHVTYE